MPELRPDKKIVKLLEEQKLLYGMDLKVLLNLINSDQEVQLFLKI